MNDEQDYPHWEYVDQIALDAARDDEHKIADGVHETHQAAALPVRHNKTAEGGAGARGGMHLARAAAASSRPPIPRCARRRSGASAGARVAGGRSPERWLIREGRERGPAPRAHDTQLVQLGLRCTRAHSQGQHRQKPLMRAEGRRSGIVWLV
ncbi:hypothetical protein C8J57DRAFT_1222656 [Mycena rebaudengoi]|nr:hypothetical protein C8J57DRAFT_1222656 [Mycena rebaudengoi]